MTEGTLAREYVPMETAAGYLEIDSSHETIEGTLVLKHDRQYLLLDNQGNIPPPARGGLGLYRDDTRILSRYELGFDTANPPVTLSSQAARMYSAQIDLALTDRDFGGIAWDPKNVVHIRREILVEDRVIERVTLTNFLTREVSFGMWLATGSDFADIFEVRGWNRDARGRFLAPVSRPAGVDFAYEGRDGAVIRSGVHFRSPPAKVEGTVARWKVRLEANESLELQWEVTAGAQPVFDDFDEHRRRLDSEYRSWGAECSTWRSDVAEFDTAIEQATTDLRALYVESEGERVPSAGIPWYSTVFGRDSIITSLQTLPLHPGIARDTLLYLAHHQGAKEDPFTEEEPGKIMHELRRGELARNGEIPHLPYYGTIDATPLFLILVHETWRWTGDDALVRRLLPNVRRALDWIDRYGDADGDGLVEYRRRSEKGLDNQGWKDSHDGVSHPDGRVAEAPIALVEVQGYVYDAWVRTAALLAAQGATDEAKVLERRARSLREAIRERFWMDEIGTFALALDGEKRAVETATSNAGHLLWSRVPTDGQAARMAKHLLGPEMFSGWGLRTLATRHPVYNPMSYHNGSVWPHDNALVALGLAHYGHTEAVVPILSALHDAACGMRYHRLPELFCGLERAHGMRPVLYPVSCSPQAWASGAFFMLLQAVTGILPDAPKGVLHVRNPMLPEFLTAIDVGGLRVGGSRVSLQFRRQGRRTLTNLAAVEGEGIRVSIEL